MSCTHAAHLLIALINIIIYTQTKRLVSLYVVLIYGRIVRCASALSCKRTFRPCSAAAAASPGSGVHFKRGRRTKSTAAKSQFAKRMNSSRSDCLRTGDIDHQGTNACCAINFRLSRGQGAPNSIGAE